MHKVAILTHAGMSLFEYAVAHELFGIRRIEAPQVRYDAWPVPAVGASSFTAAGLALRVSGARSAAEADTILVSSWRPHGDAAPVETLDLLREAHARGVRLVSFCTGSFLLAEAGLLDGRRACTHWRYAGVFRARFPAVKLEEERLYVEAGDGLYTSAGGAAAIDLGLHLIRTDFGARAARAMAHGLVAWQIREGDSPQRHEQPVPERSQEIRIARLVHGLPSRLEERLSVEQLSGEAGMSRRSFLRWFKAATGETPLAYLSGLRMRRACELLESGDRNIEEISALCGYESASAFRDMFRRSAGMSPTAYRRRRRTCPLKAVC